MHVWVSLISPSGNHHPRLILALIKHKERHTRTKKKHNFSAMRSIMRDFRIDLHVRRQNKAKTYFLQNLRATTARTAEASKTINVGITDIYSINVSCSTCSHVGPPVDPALNIKPRFFWLTAAIACRVSSSPFFRLRSGCAALPVQDFMTSLKPSTRVFDYLREEHGVGLTSAQETGN